MATILKYFLEFETSDGTIQEAEVDVDCRESLNAKSGKCLDESARRFLIGKIVEEGGRVIKIGKIDKFGGLV